ncbi:1-acyl-sn-glycerol-3-phosphate acyltransferase [Rhodothermaceae bacterium RA]|nr:1-acyl-sn-glycerol-3-phosphate acyltransferase [Rhodothermaceae bacterium RA]
MDRLISLAYLLFFVATSVVFFAFAVLIWLVTVPFDRRLVLLHLYSCFWASCYLWTLPGVRTTVSGREHVRRGVAYVIVSNHQSALDILAAYRLFIPFKWVSKAENFRIPLIGWNMVLNRYIRLHRTSRSSIRQMLEACERHLRQGSSVYLFPEGTRSETGEVGRFKPGAFALAQRLRVPVLPIAIQGTRDVLPKRSLRVRGRHHIHVQVLPEIPPDMLAPMTPEDAGAFVRARIVAVLKERDKRERTRSER